MDKTTNSLTTNGEAADSTTSFPSEPFQCPACGQLLAPACRVCVACRKAIDFGAVQRTPPPAALPAIPTPVARVRAETVPFPWRILVVVMSIGMLLGVIVLVLSGEEKGPVIIQSLPIFAGIWVFFDARRRGLPRPLRWGAGTVLLLAVILPWYLARRSRPEATVPFVEAKAGPVTRFLLIALLVLFLISLIMNIVQGPNPKGGKTPAPNLHPSGHGTQVKLECCPARADRNFT